MNRRDNLDAENYLGILRSPKPFISAGTAGIWNGSRRWDPEDDD